jgi:hypothetical protein
LNYTVTKLLLDILDVPCKQFVLFKAIDSSHELIQIVGYSSRRAHKARLQLVQWLVVVEGQCEDVVAGACAGDELSHVDPVTLCFD